MKSAISSSIAQAGMALLAEAGPRATSIRAIADRAALPPPTLQHHYPDKKRLYRGIYALAIERHHRESAAALNGLAMLAPAPDLLAPAAGALLGAWLSGSRDSTLAVLHLLAQASRDAAYADLARTWSAGLTNMIAGALECGTQAARLAVELLVGLALASTMAGRALALDILNREVLDFALHAGKRETHGRWCQSFRDRTEVAPAEPAQAADPLAHRTVRAALDAGIALMAEAGAQALTYRLIAKRAAVSPSAVLYNFPNRGALVMAIYREVHRRFARPFVARKHQDMEQDRDLAALFSEMIVGERAGAAPLVLASCELFLTAAWEEELAEHAWAMRLARGAWTTQDGGAGDFRAHVLSLWSLGVSLVHLAQHHASPRAAIADSLSGGLAIIGRPATDSGA